MGPNAASPHDKRRLDVGCGRFAVVGTNRSALYAAKHLLELGCEVEGARSLGAVQSDPEPLAVLIAGDRFSGELPADFAPTAIFLWDFEIGKPGIGAFASAVSGVSTVIGPADGPPGLLPAHMPEKWAGLFGASLALSLIAAAQDKLALPRCIDVSASDLLRAAAEQNSGNHAGVPYGWRRNGRVAIEHGGVFPQGFFRCRDGFVAIQARSRPDWQAILIALGNPDWSRDSAFQNPFRLSEDDSIVMPLLDAELMQLDRKELLDRAIRTGAPMAPVLDTYEADTWNVFRANFFGADDLPSLPIEVRRVAADEGVGR